MKSRHLKNIDPLLDVAVSYSDHPLGLQPLTEVRWGLATKLDLSSQPFGLLFKRAAQAIQRSLQRPNLLVIGTLNLSHPL